MNQRINCMWHMQYVIKSYFTSLQDARDYNEKKVTSNKFYQNWKEVSEHPIYYCRAYGPQIILMQLSCLLILLFFQLVHKTQDTLVK